jgi:hypothetical protein
MKVLNGPTPVGSARPIHGGGSAADGNWQLSPNELHATLLGFSFFGAGTTVIDLPEDCAVAFDLGEPGLAQQVDCEFVLPAGTYVTVMPIWSSEFDVLIDDSANGIYTDPTEPTKLTGTAPTGGAAMITVGTPGMMMGSGAFFDPPLVVEDAPLTLSILLNALQGFQINANAGTLTLGADGNGMPGFPDAVVAVGTPASVAYYVNDALGTPLSFGGSTPGLSNIISAVAVLQGGDQQPEFLSQRGGATECPAGAVFLFPGADNGYVGLDDNGVLGWAGKNMNGDYAALFRMAAVDDLAAATTLECAATSSDPMPPGDSFASGAPVITPARTFAMTLMAN